MAETTTEQTARAKLLDACIAVIDDGLTIELNGQSVWFDGENCYTRRDAGGHTHDYATAEQAIAAFYPYLAGVRRAVAVGPESGWRDIETAPKDREILLWAGYCCVGSWIDEYEQFGRDDHSLTEPTHWQPLPSAPKENSRE